MCGIVAMIAREQIGFTYTDRTIMQNLLLLDTFRGLDSTGAFVVENGNNNVQYAKVASHPYHLFATDLWDKMAGKLVNTGRIVVGHNRHATQGAVSSKNAHPFHENNIILVHNGTLRGGHKNLADVDVDSNAIACAFNEKGAKNVLPTLEGAFALVWWDIEAKRLFAIRNEERPLSIVVTKEVLYLASEPWMVNASAGREGRKILEVIDIEPGNLYSFDTKSGQFQKEALELLKTTPTNVVHTSGTNMSKKVRGALTVVPKTTPPVTQVETKKQDAGVAGADVLPRIELPHYANKDFIKDQEILVRVYEGKKSPAGTFWLLRGRAMEPFKPNVDVTIHVEADKLPDVDLAKYMGTPVIAKIKAYTSTANGGPTVFARAPRLDTMRKVWNGEISEHEWVHILVDGRCHTCACNIVNDEESEFTRVDRRPNNELQVVCADCVRDKIPNGALLNEFDERRTNAVQAAIAEREKLADLLVDKSSDNGSPTVH